MEYSYERWKHKEEAEPKSKEDYVMQIQVKKKLTGQVFRTSAFSETLFSMVFIKSMHSENV